MKIFAVLLQIQELFNGEFNWRGLLLLLLFVLMGLIAVGLTVFASYKVFQPKSKNKKDV
ncbi:MAG: hypothetical protein LH614_21870 [Pyrinomonadaceae bacterium]|nr:hypothetical protein [Pyrinomonadaceae bacterium]